MRKTIAALVSTLALLVTGACAHIAPPVTDSEVLAPPPAVALSLESNNKSADWVAVPQPGEDSQSQACRKTRRLCQVLMPRQDGDTPAQVAFKRSICQLYLQFECPRDEDEANRG